VLVFSSLFIVQVFFFARGSVCSVGYAGLSRGLLEEYHVTLAAHLFDLPNVSQAGLEPAASVALGLVVTALLFSQCSVAWRSFLWDRGSGYPIFESPSCLISANCGSSISA
jgi:hypothetical protein